MLLVRYYLLFCIHVGLVAVPAATREPNTTDQSATTTVSGPDITLSAGKTEANIADSTTIFPLSSVTTTVFESDATLSSEETNPFIAESFSSTTTSIFIESTDETITSLEEAKTDVSGPTTEAAGKIFKEDQNTVGISTQETTTSSETTTIEDSSTTSNIYNENRVTSVLTNPATLTSSDNTRSNEKTTLFTLDTTATTAKQSDNSHYEGETTISTPESNIIPVFISSSVTTTETITKQPETTTVLPHRIETTSNNTTTTEDSRTSSTALPHLRGTNGSNSATTASSESPVITTTEQLTTTIAPIPDLSINLQINKKNSTSINIIWQVDNYYESSKFHVRVLKSTASPENGCDMGSDIDLVVPCCQYTYDQALPGVSYTINVSADNVFATKTDWIMQHEESPLVQFDIINVTSTTATVNLKLNKSKTEQPQYMKIILRDQNVTSEEYCLWNSSENLDKYDNYETIKIDYWDLIANKSEPFSVVLGSNETCSDQQTNCNRPLKHENRYFTSIAFFYKNYYHTTQNGSFITKKRGIVDKSEPTNLALALGLIFGLIFISATGYLVVMLWRRGVLKIIDLRRFRSSRDHHPDDNENLTALLSTEKKATSETYIPGHEVKVDEFVAYCKYLEENPDEQRAQWEKLDAESKALDAQYETNFAVLPENKRKNRYPNILPWDHCRVKLKIDEDDEICSDYVNASYIKGASNNNEYIATQGPLAGTCRDFWKMVIQENVNIIVMVSKFIENNRDKCYKYFPKNHETMLVGDDLEVRCATELHFGVYCVRTLQVRKDYISVIVIHMQFLEWPDFGVPTGTENMLQFCHQLRNRWCNEGGLALIHCSAGVGRTGTLIATDILLQAIETETKINVYNTILEMRKQRRSMVQTQKQYMYIHQLIKSMLEDPIVTEPPDTEPVYENIIINVDRQKDDPLLDQDKGETAESAF